MFPEIQSMRERERTRVSKSMPAFKRTRLNYDGAETRTRIIVTCQELMLSGRFRPTQKELLGAGLKLKALKYHFQCLPDLYDVALDDATRAGVLARIMPNGPWPSTEDCARIIRAVLIGRLVAT